MAKSGSNNAGPELLVELDRAARLPLRAQLEDGLREAVRSGRLAGGTRLPASRTLAGDLGVSRRLVVDAYAQLLAEGYLLARHGDGTYVADGAGTPSGEAGSEPPEPRLSFDFFPGHPDLASFPRRAWLRAMRDTLNVAPARSLGYPDARGAAELRGAVAEHVRRVRGVVAQPQTVVVCSGTSQALVLVARALGSPHIAVEDPGLPHLRAILEGHGARLSPLPVDERGARTDELAAIEAGRGPLDAVFVTPAHQSPTGVALAPERRAALLEWASASAGLVLEDDYDAEHRYDRAPLGALQGLAPDRVIYLGTASKTLAPALRLGWLVLPPGLVRPVVNQRLLADHGGPTLEQLTLARMLESGAYDRHMRQARRRNRQRRDALVAAVARHLPGARVDGLAAGLHALVRLGHPLDALALMRACAERSVGVYPLGYAYAHPRPREDGLILGYASLAEPQIEEGVRRLADAVVELRAAAAAA
jgi:GntR family transcriptional regulator/MocR family aminotransferase